MCVCVCLCIESQPPHGRKAVLNMLFIDKFTFMVYEILGIFVFLALQFSVSSTPVLSVLKPIPF